jgi:hypothetical protein
MNAAQGLLEDYEGSLHRLLQATYVDHVWQQWRFTQVPKGYWANRDNRKAFLEAIAPKLGVKSLSDWYGVSKRDVKRLGSYFAWFKEGQHNIC